MTEECGHTKYLDWRKNGTLLEPLKLQNAMLASALSAGYPGADCSLRIHSVLVEHDLQ